MKLKLISACVAAVCIMNCWSPITAPAMNAADKIMVIEDFESYTSKNDMLQNAFWQSKITSHSDTEAHSTLSTDVHYNGGKSFGVGGTYTPVAGATIGGMVNPYLLVPEGKRNWTNASHLQFWVSNPTDRMLGIRLALMTGETFTNHTLPSDKFTTYLEKRPGEGVFTESSNYAGTYRVWIPAGFMGMVRIPLSLFADLTDLSNVQRIYLGMNVNDGKKADTVKYLYYDYFHVVTEDYVNPCTQIYTPEFYNAVVRIDEQAHQLKVSGTINSNPGEETFLLEVFDENNISCASAHFKSSTEGEQKINYVLKLPETLPPGQYILRITTQENSGFNFEYTFPIYGTEQLCYNDIYDEKCETGVEFLYNLGILPGYSDGSFRPSQAITYGELVDALTAISKAPRNTIIGYAETTIDETADASYNIMLKMIMKTIGYTETSDSKYANSAKKLAVTNTRDWTANQNSRGNAAVMIRNAMTVEMKENGVLTKNSLLSKNFESEMDRVRLNAAVRYGDTVLKYDRDAYGDTETPMFIDGINIYTKQPAVYTFDGVTSVLSNFASQQNTLRTLEALSNITGDAKYVNRAKECIRYFLTKAVDNNGAPYMGGHTWWDAAREQTAHSKTYQLELKFFFPYYDLWYETDSELASRTVGAIWDAKMTDWENMKFSRHGSYNKNPTAKWDNKWNDPEPWLKVGSGLPFYLAGADLAVAGYKEKQHTGNEKAGVWAKRVIEMYRKASDPTTHLFPDIFVLSGGSSVRDRGLDQFGVDFPEETYGFKATEGNIQGTYHTTVGSVPDILSLYDKGLIDDETLGWIVEDHLGYLEYQYDAEHHKNKYILNDGTDMEGYVLKKDGYFGSTGTVLKASSIGRDLLPSFVGLYLRTNREEFWTHARDLAAYYGLGDIGTAPGENVSLNFAAKLTNPGNVFALCELYNETGCADYLKLAKTITNSYVIHMRRGFFMTHLDDRAFMGNWSYNKVYASFDVKDAWAILKVQECIDGETGLVADFTNGYGNVLDDYDGFRGGDDPYARSSIGANSSIYRGEYDIEMVMDYNLSGTEVAGKQSDEALITVSGNNINCEMIFSGNVPQSGYKIIAAIYGENGEIISFVTPDEFVNSEINGMRDINFSFSLTKENMNKAKYVKCFVWTINEMKPLIKTDAVSIVNQ